jgi:hypothetical protein
VDLAAPALPTGPDVAAAKSTAKRTMTRKSDGKFDLTKEARLENARFEASGFSSFLTRSVQVLPCQARALRNLESREPDQRRCPS